MVSYPLNTQMSDVLTPPELGTRQLDIDPDDPRFNVLNDAISSCTEFYEMAQTIVDKVGEFPGPRIQQTDAVELFVQPFSGDWNAITACGDAVHKAGLGLQAVAENLTAGMLQLFAGTGGGWQGDSATAFQAHMGLHVAVYEGAGLVVSQGKVIFDGISTIAMEIGEVVVGLIDTALDLGAWLIEKIARYAKPWIGLVQAAYDIVTKGWEAVQDIIDTVTSLVETIQSVFELHEAVRTWVETIPAELEVFQQLVGIFESIPDLTQTPILTAVQIQNEIQGVSTGHAELAAQRQQAQEQAAAAAQQLTDLEMGIDAPTVPTSISGIDDPGAGGS